MTEEGSRVDRRRALRSLSSPSSVAIIGGSADETKISGRPVKFLRRLGYPGAATIVNPTLPVVEGFTSVESIAALGGPPDVAFVALGAAGAAGAVRELGELGTPAAIVLASGYAESGPEGVRLQRELAEAAGPMRILGPNSLGVINLTEGILLSASDVLESRDLVRGRIGVASQSGGVMASLLSRAGARGIGFSTLFATGNEADLEVTDCLEHLIDDDATAVIALYLESLRDPLRFLDSAQRAAAADKAVVVYKIGRSEIGQRAAASHTGALAGNDRIYDALFEQAGVIRAARFADLLDISTALASPRRMAGRRVGVLTTTGGAGTLLADACGSLGLVLPPPDGELVQKVQDLLPTSPIDTEHNPIDLTLAGIRPEIITPVIEQFTRSPVFDAVVVVVGSSALAFPNLVADPLIAAANRPGEGPILAYVSPSAPGVLALLNLAGVPAFDSPEGCASALVASVWPPPIESPPIAPASRSMSHSIRTAPGEVHQLNEAEAKDLLARYHIASPRRLVVADPAEAERAARRLGSPLAVKLLARGLTHKSDIGALALDVAREDVAASAATVLARAHEAFPDLASEGILLEEMAGGPEVILGMVRTDGFGAVILLGSGGIFAELIDDTVLALPPIDEERAQSMIASLRVAPILAGARGRPPADTEALVRTVVLFSQMVDDLGARLFAAEINPVVILEHGQGVLAVDALVSLEETGDEPRLHSTETPLPGERGTEGPLAR